MEPAIAYVRDNRVDVAFLDIEMYDTNGIEVAKQLKEINPEINIIFSTGYKEYMEEAFSLYASGYITKPATEDKVREQLKNLRHPVREGSKNAFHGEYMSQYSWGEDRISVLEEEKCRK